MPPDAAPPETLPPVAGDAGSRSDRALTGPPAWALGAALVVSGDIFAYWAVRVPGEALTVTLNLLGLLVRLVGLVLLLRWALPFRTFWAYLLAALFVVGLVHVAAEAFTYLP